MHDYSTVLSDGLKSQHCVQILKHLLSSHTNHCGFKLAGRLISHFDSFPGIDLLFLALNPDSLDIVPVLIRAA